MFEANLDCEIESSAISTRLAATDDLSEHESPYFETVSASTMLVALRGLVAVVLLPGLDWDSPIADWRISDPEGVVAKFASL